MDVLIVGDNLSIETPDAMEDVAVIAATPINFPIDFGPMMDQWGGGVVVARIEPIDNDAEVYRVVEFDPIPVTFRQVGEDGLALDASDGSWFLQITDNGKGAITLERGGKLPDFNSGPLTALGRWMDSFTLNPT